MSRGPFAIPLFDGWAGHLASDTVGVAPNDTVRVLHFGSAFSKVDYITQAHSIYAMASYFPTEKLQTVGTIVYNKSTGAYDPVESPEVEHLLDGHLHHLDYHYDEVHKYSELDYAKLEDNNRYVYGNESGSYYLVRGGARPAVKSCLKILDNSDI
jgi:hypothetical protein